IAQLAARLHLDRLDARPRGGLEVLLADCLGKRALHEVGDGFGMYLRAELLLDHRIGNLTRPKALEPGRAGEALEALVHLSSHPVPGHRHFQSPLQARCRRYRYLHPFSPVDRPVGGTSGFEPLVRKERLELSRVTPLASKASASTIPPLSLVGGHPGRVHPYSQDQTAPT